MPKKILLWKRRKWEITISNTPWHKTHTAVQKKQGFPFPCNGVSFWSDSGYSRSCFLGHSSLSMVLRGHTREQGPFQAMYHLSSPVEPCQVLGRLLRGMKEAVIGEGEQDGGGVGGCECISLHGYIRNTPSDTEVYAEQQLWADRSTWPVEKNI